MNKVNKSNVDKTINITIVIKVVYYIVTPALPAQ